MGTQEIRDSAGSPGDGRGVAPSAALPARTAAGRVRSAAQGVALVFLVFAPLWDALGWAGALPPWWPPVSWVMIAVGIVAACLAVLLRTLQRRVLVRGGGHYAGGRQARGTLLELVAIGLLLAAWVLRGDAEIPPDPPLVVTQLIALAVYGFGARLRAAAVLALLVGLGCSGAGDRLVLATTSSAYDTGLLDAIVATWAAEEAPPPLHVLVTGSGEALALGRRGDADVLLVHAPEAEAEFMAAEHGIVRIPVMSSDLLLVGPASDPAGLADAADLRDAVRRLDAAGPFVTRGDGSGTHQRELRIRRATGLAEPIPSPRYMDAGAGMAATLRVASERVAYTLTDRGTWEISRAALQLVEFPLSDELLDNRYSVIVPRRARTADGALRFARWLAGPRGQAVIGAFRGPSGALLFVPADGRQDMP